MKEHLLNLSKEEIKAQLEQWNEAPFRAGQIINWVYAKRIFDFSEMSNLSSSLRTRLNEEWDWYLPSIEKVVGEGTRKFLLRMSDGEGIETVLLTAHEGGDGAQASRQTLCVSSQAGCAYGCKFCATGQGGWRRDLRPHEIVGQVLAIEAHTQQRMNNIVFMGMGEPFANYESVMKSIVILNSLVGIGARHITVSTCGLPTEIQEFARQPLQVRLAVSLHSTNDAVRGSIMPVNAKYPVATVLAACAEFVKNKKHSLTLEYTLIAGVNDDLTHATALADCAARLLAKVNLIPYNAIEGLDWERPSEIVMRKFLATLERRGIAATLRHEKGGDIAAACGQLR